MLKVAKYAVYDILQNRFVLAYMLFLLVVSMSFFNLENDPVKGMMSLLNIILIVLPLVSIVFATIHLYNSYEFMELMLAQPLRRSDIFMGQYLGMAASLCIAFGVGVGVPVLIYDGSGSGAILVLCGLLLTLSFVSMAFLATVLSRDKARGIGIALLLWFFCTILYDGLVLMSMFAFSDYPLEKAVIGLAFLNPVDLARIAMLLQLDAAALMGYTGALFQHFFGSVTGGGISLLAMMAWIVLPLWWAARIFQKKDI
ncbi:MAG: ABC transporter permease subunit [Saprospirales bacterium]|nr:ABC transporter permease subunit [Saprospirales bacterium]MBK8921179.1 ABC transporter permease subunit [Saprospirales bacterium]